MSITKQGKDAFAEGKSVYDCPYRCPVKVHRWVNAYKLAQRRNKSWDKVTPGFVMFQRAYNAIGSGIRTHGTVYVFLHRESNRIFVRPCTEYKGLEFVGVYTKVKRGELAGDFLEWFPKCTDNDVRLLAMRGRWD